MDIFEYFTDQFEVDNLSSSNDILLSSENETLINNPELFYHQGSEAIKEMLSKEKNLKIWKLVFIQMHYNETIRTFFQNEILMKPLMFWNGFFTILKEKGIIREDSNPELLAKEYYSFPIYSLLELSAKYDDIPQSSIEKFFEETEEHAKFILDCVKVKK